MAPLSLLEMADRYLFNYKSYKNCCFWLLGLAGTLLLAGCGDSAWNNPHPPKDPDKSTYYSLMYRTPPKHLDPALSYATDESLFVDQIYQSPLGYHFLKRPYELIPLGVEAMPGVEYMDRNWRPVERDNPKLAYTRYTFRVREDARYQPHPALALDDEGEPLYRFDTAAESAQYKGVPDFEQTGTRNVQARDYVYGIKRLADPKNKSPMLSLMGQYIVGLRDFSIKTGAQKRGTADYLDLEQFEMKGAQVLDERTFQITIYEQYPQFLYWLAMHFFSPIPPEADAFYKNPGFKEKNLTLDWWPIGSGAFMIVKNDPNSEIVLERNPNFHEDYYPSEGAPGDLEAGHLDDAGKRVPFIDRAHFRLEKEVLPLWTKFLQGYYERSGEVHANTSGFFDQTFVVGPEGLELSPEMRDRKLSISKDVKPSIYYYGFNMRDPVVGGYTEEKRKLRQALSLAFDTEEYLNIFYKGNAIAAQSPIPPGIPGALEGEEGINRYIYDWLDDKPQRKSVEYARQLMSEAGYPGGRDEDGKPLRIFIDVQSQAVSNSSMRWMRRQLERIGVQVEFRPADWNRTREKLMTGNTQIFSHGWLADYPDPENFLFLLYGPESPLVCKCDGANNSNYESKEYDELFQRMRAMDPGPERSAIVAQMVDLWRRDAVWLFTFHPLEFYLNNEWVHNTKRHGISKRTLKYIRLDEELRDQRRAEWNKPVVWPMVVAAIVVIGLVIPGVIAYRRRQRATVREQY
jgi:ABC-type oligopeptide transport system substrate-binding subunit